MIRKLENKYEPVILTPCSLAKYHIESQGWYIYHQDLDVTTDTWSFYCDYLSEDGNYKTRAEGVSYIIDVKFEQSNRTSYLKGYNNIKIFPPRQIQD